MTINFICFYFFVINSLEMYKIANLVPFQMICNNLRHYIATLNIFHNLFWLICISLIRIHNLQYWLRAQFIIN